MPEVNISIGKDKAYHNSGFQMHIWRRRWWSARIRGILWYRAQSRVAMNIGVNAEDWTVKEANVPENPYICVDPV